MRNILFAVLVLAALSVGTSFAQKSKIKKPATPSFYVVSAVIKMNCMPCHQGPRPKKGLNLTSYQMIMKGDKEGKVIMPKNPASSRLSMAIHRKGATPMPPMKPLPAAQVAMIDAWIKGGAPSK